MVSRPGKEQLRFTSGELDPLMQQNTDEETYFKGASVFTNVKSVPQGGFTVRWGTTVLGVARNMLEPVVPLGATAPSGIATNTLDGLTTTALVTAPLAAPAVVLSVTLPAGSMVSCVDLENFAGSYVGGAVPVLASPTPPLAPPIAGTVSVALSADNVHFTTLDNVVALGDALRTRRFAAPAGAPVAAQYIQVTVSVAAAANIIFTLANLRVFAETAQVSPVRVRSFTHSRTIAYDLVFTDQNAEVYGINGRVASVPLCLSATALTGSMVAAMKNTQQLDTMILFHQQLQPLRIRRMGADTEWDCDPLPLQNIPNFDFGAGYANGVPAQWEVSFFNFDTSTGSIPMPSGGAHYTISVNGVPSPAIQQPPANYSGTAAALQAAIAALPGVGPGVTVVLTSPPLSSTGASSVPPIFTITFAGPANVGDGWAVSGVAIDKADAAITAAHTVTGVLGGEPVISAARGWPACGCFFEQRLVMAGLAGVPNAALASEVGNYFQFDTLLRGASAPMLIPLDTDGAATIVDIHYGRTLDFFCDAGEYWLASGALDATATPVIVRGTTNGIAPTVDAFENEGKTIYVAREGGALFEFVFNYAEQNYDSNNMSITSAQLVQSIIDGALRRLTASTDVNELYCVRADGQALICNLLRQQNITSFARLVTDGQFLAVNVNDRFEVTFAVARQVNGATTQFIERMAENVLLDAQVSVNVAAGATSLTGLGNYNDATVYAIVDGFVQGPFVVAGGVINLDFAAEAAGAALVGRWTAPMVATLPQPKDIGPRTVRRRPCRVHTVRATTVATSNLAIGANGDGPYEVALGTYGTATDVPPDSAPYTGPVIQSGLQGFTEDGIVTFTQTRPGLLTVTGITVEVDL
ncbi:MAG: hypothetical protein KGQ37_09450 [Hyphomicrobiales bacterium]|nr:hypothetical protein [Hyphomicrobiales bacterium]